jgi:uncharacterized membrane protein YdbT with pleckstrin-like domain
MRITPDPRLRTKVWLVLATISAFVLVGAGIAQVFIWLFADSAGLMSAIMWGSVGGALLLMWVVSVPIAVLWIKNLAYEVTHDAVLIHKGILTKTQQNIPLRMVTDFRLQRTLFDRWLGIGSLLVQTAGQSTNTPGYEGRLSGLAEWGALHAELTSRVRDARVLSQQTTPAGDPFALLVDEVHQIRQLLEASEGSR